MELATGAGIFETQLSSNKLCLAYFKLRKSKEYRYIFIFANFLCIENSYLLLIFKFVLHTGCSLNIVFFFKYFDTYSGVWSFECLCTDLYAVPVVPRRTDRWQFGHQQIWQSSEKSHFFKEKTQHLMKTLQLLPHFNQDNINASA